eukprot:gb/GEZN01003532.1/.p1 GENE.gb/GEZN01003532.1/~~gb/GEZN01003532.1/.p1  ORF type:complete len:652 (-),score=171.12 gb/GEZN01003532.1/:197-2125(-)
MSRSHGYSLASGDHSHAHGDGGHSHSYGDSGHSHGGHSHGHSHGGQPCHGHVGEVKAQFGDPAFDYKSRTPGLLVDVIRLPQELIDDAKLIIKTEKAKKESDKLEKQLKKTQKKIKKEQHGLETEDTEADAKRISMEKKLAKKQKKIKKAAATMSEIIVTDEHELSDMRKQAGYFVITQAAQMSDVALQLHFRPEDVLPEVMTLATAFAYHSHMLNSGFSGWVYLTDAGTSAEPIQALRQSLETLGAKENLIAFNRAVENMKTIPVEKLELYQKDERVCTPSCCNEVEEGCPKLKAQLDLFTADIIQILEEEDSDQEGTGKKKGKKKPKKKKQGKKEKTTECLETLMIDYALRLAANSKLVEVEEEEDEANPPDSLNVLTPTWWPAALPQIQQMTSTSESVSLETSLPSSATMLSGLRRAAASSGFAFIMMGRPPKGAGSTPSPITEQKTEKKDQQKKKGSKKGKKKGKKTGSVAAEQEVAPLPQPSTQEQEMYPIPEKLIGIDEIFGHAQEEETPLSKVPMPETRPFWVTTSRGPVISQIFLEPREAKPWEKWALEQAKEGAQTEEQTEESASGEDLSFFSRVAVFLTEDGSEVVGMGAMDEEDEDLDEDDEEDDEDDDEESDEDDESEGELAARPSEDID